VPILESMGGRFVRGIAAAAVAACTLAATATAGQSTAGAVSAADSLEHAVLVEVNAFRARHGLRPLRLHTRLEAAADVHSRAMAHRGFFGHRSADGSASWQRIRRYYGGRRLKRSAVGENLVWSTGRVDATVVMRYWLRSPRHRRNLLTPKWRAIGISALHVASAPGFFRGGEVTILTADFGTRR
jgi:uncharacterized protein YkwD